MTDMQEQLRRKELTSDSRRALAIGKTIDQYRAERDSAVESLTNEIRALMERHGCDDPVELLPQLLIDVREQAVEEARHAAKSAAQVEVRRMLKKAIER
jgi:hypothetical protein